MEPYRLRRWRSRTGNFSIHTCGRPGRSKGPDAPVGDEVVDKWIKGLPGDGGIAIISLLGRKNGPNGDSEFKFYSFHGRWDSPSECRSRPSFGEWINGRGFIRSIEVIEHPTFDFKPIPDETLDAVSKDIYRVLDQKLSVILIDSGGQTRTGRVCAFMNFLEDSAKP
jgi:hypothetical protein